MFHSSETDIRKQKKYEMRTQTSVDNTVNDLRYQIKFGNSVNDKNNFFIKVELSPSKKIASFASLKALMKNVFSFTTQALFILKIFKFLS